MSETATVSEPTRKPETIAKATRNELVPQIVLGTAKDMDPTSGAKKELAIKIGKEMGLGKEPDEILEGLVDTVPSIKVDGKNAQKAIEEHLASDAAKKAEAEAQDLLVRDFLGKKYDALDAAGQTKMRDFVEAAIQAWPPGRELLDNITDPTQREEILKGILKDPEFRTILETQYNGLFNTDPPQWKIPENPEDSPEVIEAEKKYQLARLAEQKVQDEQAVIQRNIREVNRIADEHDITTDPATGQPRGSRAREIIRLDGAIATAEAGDSSYGERLKTTVDTKRTRIEDLRASLKQKGLDAGTIASINNDIITLQGEVVTDTASLNEYNLNVSKRNKLVSERDGLEARKTELEQQEMDKYFEIGKKSSEASVAQADLEELRIDLARRGGGVGAEADRLKNELASKLDGVVTKATKEWLNAQVTKAIEKLGSEWTAMAEERNNKAEKAMINNIEDLYYGSEKQGRFRKKNIEAEKDFKMLTDPTKGIDAIFEDELLLVAKEWPEEYFVYDMTTHEPIGLSDHGREQFKTTHKEFSDRVKNKLAKTTMEMKMQAGGISKGEVESIMKSSWLRELIEDDKEGIGAKIEEIKHKEGFVGSNLQWLNEKANSGVGLAALFLIFGPIPPLIIYMANRKKGGGHGGGH